MDSSNKNIIRVGSRKSELALIQTNYVIDCLKKIHPDKEFKIITMTTLGDRILDISLPKIGEKSLFTKDLEDALRNDTVDFVVHSLKDLPTTLPDGLAIGAILEREDPRDALVLREDLREHTLDTLPEGSVIGTSSLRRAAQLRRRHPALRVADVRGNLNTRLRKLDASGPAPGPAGPGFSALMLAKSGLSRMNWEHRIDAVLPCGRMLFAVGQGALAAECRAGRADVRALLRPLSHASTLAVVLAERSFLKALGGGCSAPVGVSSSFKPFENQYKLTITGAVWSLDGATEIKHKLEHCFKQIKNSETAKHKLSPDEDEANKKFKSDATHPLQKLDDLIKNRSCEDTRTPEEIQALKNDVKLHCGIIPHSDLLPEVVEKCEAIGKELASELIRQGALEVMKVTQELIRSSVGEKTEEATS